MGRTSPAIDAGEWRFVAGVTAALLAITSAPYVYAWWSAPPDRQFMGILVNVPDHAQYFAWMRGLAGAHLMSNTLTPEPNPPLFFNLLWWTVGRAGRALGLGYGGSLQLLRLAAAPLFLIAVYRQCALFLDDRFLRRVAFLVIALTSGFGWVLVALKYTLAGGELYFPLDVFIAEGNTFYCLLASPHFIAAALYIVVFELLLRGEATGQRRWSVAAGLLTLCLGWQHAYDLAAVYAIVLSYALLRLLRDRRLPRQLIESGAIIAALSCWPGLYSVLLTRLEPTWRVVLGQFGNAGVYTPNLPHLVILLGPVLLLAAFAVARTRHLRALDDRALFLRAWFLGNFAVIYLPVDWQIHLLNGWQVPLGILATQAVFVPRVSGWAAGARHRLAALLLLAVVPTNLYLYAWRFVDLARHERPYYLLDDELAALAWLDAHVTAGDVVLSSETIGQYVPSSTGARAFLAHWAQTVDYYDKVGLVRRFFAAETDAADRRDIVRRFGVDYVYFSDSERALGGFVPAADPSLTRVFASPRAEVYRVDALPPGGAPSGSLSRMGEG